jgi:hypothetical protein
MESSINGLKSTEQGSLIAESAALARGAEFLNKPAIKFGQNNAGYEYKRWIPVWIPFIQASSGIWNPVTQNADTSSNWQNGSAGPTVPGAEHLPFNVFIPAGQHFDFQILTPRGHPFLLLDVKVSSTFRTTEGSDPGDTTLHGRYTGPYINTSPLFRKYAYPDNEGIETTIIAVSPGGKPIWGALQNSVGLDNSIRTVGPVPHTERIPLANSQNHRSGRGALQHHLLFPEDGILRVTVENRNVNASEVDDTPDGAFVTGVVYGYIIME